MRTFLSFIIILLFSTILNASFFGQIDEPIEDQQPTEEITGSHWKLHVYIGYLDTDPIPDLKFNTLQTDTTSQQILPVMFEIPDASGNIIDISEYLNLYGDLPYKEFLPLALEEYYKSMFRGFVVDVIIETDPISGSEYWELESQEIPFHNIDSYLFELKYQILDKYKTHYGDTSGQLLYDKFANWDDHENMVLLVPRSPSPNDPDGFTRYRSDYINATYAPGALNFTTHVVGHEIAHNIFNFTDKGYDANKYAGFLDGESMGLTFSTTGAYDMMYHCGNFPSPFALYGLMPFHTQDIINQETFSVSLFKNIPTVIENDISNKTQIRIKAVRKKLDTTEISNGIANAIIVPVEGDVNETEPENTWVSGDLVEDQHFLIEYRDGEGFDNLTALYNDYENLGHHEKESKGILISHVINGSELESVIDIECAGALPAGSRDPSLSWNTQGDAYYEFNGLWYCGKPESDWLDDLLPNDNYPDLGGKGAWWRHPSALNMCSLPTDFFNDTDRNMFTPTTYPSTKSWKDNETNIGIFIDNIDGDYADVTVYRNYHSNPLTAKNAKDLPEGEKGLTIAGDGYIGEKFYVDAGMNLLLTNPPSTTDLFTKTTLIPGTDMYIGNNALLNVDNDKTLRLENSKLKFNSGSNYFPNDTAIIELCSSNLIYEDGSTILNLRLNNYDISVEGQSSFYHSNIDLIGSSVLTLNEGSKFTLLAGTNMNLSSETVLTIKDGSELVIENGSSLTMEQGARIEVEGNAKITGDLTLPSFARLELLENSTLTINGSSTLYLDEKSEIYGLEGSSLIVGQYSSLITTVQPDYNEVTENNYIEMTGNNWNGIVCELNSTIILNRTRISGAEYAISGSPDGFVTYEIGSSCIIEQCEITNCENGISLAACRNPQIKDNTLNGLDIGTGVSLTQSYADGLVEGNTIENFDRGVRIISGSPLVLRNTIRNNRHSGLYITGFNSSPQLINPMKYSALNNEISYNGYVPDHPVPSISYPAQICVLSKSYIYLDYGMNNIVSRMAYQRPEIPCVSAHSLIPVGGIQLLRPIYARGNYWGSSYVNNDFFSMGEGYSIIYDPIEDNPFGSNPVGSPLPEPDSKSWKLLQKALIAELDGKYDKAIHSYEKIIEKYPDSPEAIVAYAKLPDSYNEEGLDLEPLISLYDAQLASDDETVNKKFFKEMKVATKIKGKKYDEAIAISEEMILEAETEEEEILCEIDIAICNMLKDSESKGKSTYDSSTINDLMAKLNEGEGDGEKTEIDNGELIIDNSELFQNYPNPFNPTTEISYALSQDANVSIKVYSSNGSIVADLVNASQSIGHHSVIFDASKLSNGIFYYSLVANGRVVSTKKMLLLK